MALSAGRFFAWPNEICSVCLPYSAVPVVTLYRPQATDQGADVSHPESLKPPSPLPDSDIRHWMLSDELIFLNHGSFGARPRPIYAMQEDLRRSNESRPIEALVDQMIDVLPVVKRSIGQFIGADPDGIGMVQNASEAINSVVRSIEFAPGDEIVTTTHGYNAVLQLLRYVSNRSGAVLHEIPVPIPVRDAGESIAAVLDAISDRTRLVLIDHVTSPTALHVDVAGVIEHCRARGIDVLVDGAHAPGMLELDVTTLAPTWYVGNLHKWVCAPIGAAFLWTEEACRDRVHPAIISHGYTDGYAAEFDWQGTRDMSAWRLVPDVIDWMERQWGWASIRAHNHALATWAHAHLVESWNSDPLTPLSGELLGSMAAIRLPEGPFEQRFGDPLELQRHLRHDFGIEVPIMDWGGRWLLRVSAQIYNRPDDYLALDRAVKSITASL